MEKVLEIQSGKTKAPVGNSFGLMVCNSGNAAVGGEVKSTKLETIKWKIKKNSQRKSRQLCNGIRCGKTLVVGFRIYFAKQIGALRVVISSD